MAGWKRGNIIPLVDPTDEAALSRPVLAQPVDMTLEQIPLIIGAIISLIGIAICFDSYFPRLIPAFRERRRRTRVELNQKGEFLLGIGAICMGAAVMGRDTWKFATVSVIAGALLVVIGGILNRGFVKEMLFFRGASRRKERDPATDKTEGPPKKMRIR